MSGLIQAGRLNRRILLQTAIVSQDEATGAEIVTWPTDVAGNEDLVSGVPLRAEWLSGSTSETYRVGNRLATYIEGIFRIRYREPIPNEKTNRVVMDGRVYDIKPAIELGLREGLDLPAVARR